MNFRNAVLNVISDSNFIPPENFMELELTNFKNILKLSPKEVCVQFAAGEARLVLPVFESACPGDDRPRKAIESAGDWKAADTVDAARADIGNTSSYAADAACEADPSITLENQLKRLFKIMRRYELGVII